MKPLCTHMQAVDWCRDGGWPAILRLMWLVFALIHALLPGWEAKQLRVELSLCLITCRL